jgi:hypothetical protein
VQVNGRSSVQPVSSCRACSDRFHDVLFPNPFPTQQTATSARHFLLPGGARHRTAASRLSRPRSSHTARRLACNRRRSTSGRRSRSSRRDRLGGLRRSANDACAAGSALSHPVIPCFSSILMGRGKICPLIPSSQAGHNCMAARTNATAPGVTPPPIPIHRAGAAVQYAQSLQHILMPQATREAVDRDKSAPSPFIQPSRQADQRQRRRGRHPRPRCLRSSPVRCTDCPSSRTRPGGSRPRRGTDPKRVRVGAIPAADSPAVRRAPDRSPIRRDAGDVATAAACGPGR